MTIAVNFGMYGFNSGEDDALEVEGMTVEEVYLLFDDLQRDISGTVTRKLFIKPYINGIQTSDDPIGDTTVVKDGDLVEFRRVPPPDYTPSRKTSSAWRRIKHRIIGM